MAGKRSPSLTLMNALITTLLVLIGYAANVLVITQDFLLTR